MHGYDIVTFKLHTRMSPGAIQHLTLSGAGVPRLSMSGVSTEPSIPGRVRVLNGLLVPEGSFTDPIPRPSTASA